MTCVKITSRLLTSYLHHLLGIYPSIRSVNLLQRLISHLTGHCAVRHTQNLSLTACVIDTRLEEATKAYHMDFV